MKLTRISFVYIQDAESKTEESSELYWVWWQSVSYIIDNNNNYVQLIEALKQLALIP